MCSARLRKLQGHYQLNVCNEAFPVQGGTHIPPCVENLRNGIVGLLLLKQTGRDCFDGAVPQGLPHYELMRSELIANDNFSKRRNVH